MVDLVEDNFFRRRFFSRAATAFLANLVRSSAGTFAQRFFAISLAVIIEEHRTLDSKRLSRQVRSGISVINRWADGRQVV